MHPKGRLIFDQHFRGSDQDGRSRKLLAALRSWQTHTSVFLPLHCVERWLRWLEKFNKAAADKEMPYHQRPFHALLAWTEENKCSVILSSDFSNKVEAWFLRHSPPSAHNIGSLFTGVYFYDGHCWRVAIPLAYGSVRLDPWSSLVEMPETIAAKLRQEPPSWVDFLSVWADCVDYAFGRDDLFATAPDGFAKQLFTSANQQLDATVSLLLEEFPNPKVMESARLATEMFLKCFIGFHRGISQPGAKVIRHDLDRALRECLTIRPSSELAGIGPRLSQFPTMGARYEAKHYQRCDLWFAYGTAQFTGSALVRSLTDRNMRKQVEDMLNSYSAAEHSK